LGERLQRYNRALHYALGIEQALYKNPPAHSAIIMYHNVLPNTRTDVNIRNISTSDFRKQLRYFKKRFDIVPLSKIFDNTARPNSIAITFDDGLINNLRHALPIIEEEKVPVTFFVSTSWLNGQSMLWPDLLSLLLCKEQYEVEFEKLIYKRVSPIHFKNELTGQLIQQALLAAPPNQVEAFIETLSKKLNFLSEQQDMEDMCRVMKGEETKILSQSKWVEIGSHCVSHHNLLHLADDKVKDELTDSKNYLEKVTGYKVESIAYPFGLYNARIKALAKEAGYTRQLAVNYLLPEDHADSSICNRLGLYSDRSCAEQLHAVNEFVRTAP
jgi:peptidoglycan/xylan/chitin deacetylase (PgdA/CDA1 family)